MKNIIIVEENLELLNTYAINFKVWLNSTVHCFQEAKFAIPFLDEKKAEIDLIICRNQCKLEKSYIAIKEYYTGKSSRPCIIILGQCEDAAPEDHPLETTLHIQPLIRLAAEKLTITANDMAQFVVPEHYPIDLKYFQFIMRSSFDVYTQDSGNETNYFVKFKANEEISRAEIKGYIERKEEYLYVQAKDRLKFVTELTEDILGSIFFEDLNEDEQVQATEIGYDKVGKKLNKNGMTEDALLMAQNQMRNVAELAYNNKSLKKLISGLVKNKSSYRFKHTLIVTNLCTKIVDMMKWSNSQQLEKMSFVVFFRDILLQSDEQAMIRSTQELKESDLDPDQKKIVSTHAQAITQILSRYPNAPMGADSIILQHHGVTNGYGFSESYSNTLSPMSLILILCEDYADSYLKEKDQFSSEAKLKQMREKYSTTRFKDILNALESLV